MQKLFSEITLGTYTPAFFQIYIDSDSDLDDFSKLSDMDLNVLFHEYTHFMQDLLTIYGLRNVLHVIDTTKALIQQILKTADPVQLPITYFKEEIINVNIDLHSFYTGDSTAKIPFTKIESFHVIIDKVNLPNGSTLDVPYVEIAVYHALDPDHKISKLHIGAITILENMAYLMEPAIEGKSLPPRYPYRTVEFIANEIAPQVDWTRSNLITLCEICLQTFNPAHKLFDFLKRINEAKEIPINNEDLIGLNNGYTIDGVVPNEYHLQLFEVVRAQILSFFPVEVLLPVNRWIDKLFSKSKDMINKGFSFANLIENKTSEEIADNYILIMKEMGLPLLSNKKGKYWADNELSAAQLVFKAIIESYKILRDYYYESCDLYEFCNLEKITCDLCKTAPWKRISEGKVCSLTTLWKIWGINEKVFVK